MSNTTARRTVGVDLDGVCYDFVSTLGDYIAQRTGRDRASFPAALTWDFYRDQWGMTVGEYLDFVRDGVNAGHLFRVGDPLPGVISGFNRLRAAGTRIVVVTDRTPKGAERSAKLATLNWLEEHGLLADQVLFNADKTVITGHCPGPEPPLFIDDRPSNIEALTQSGVTVLARRRPWNDGMGFNYVESFGHFVDTVLSGGLP